MLIEKELEGKILTALADCLPADVKATVVGFWQPTALGEVKGWEDSDSAALLEVAVGLGQQETFSNPVVSFNVAVALAVRLELDAQAENILKLVEPISELFKDWMAATYQQTFTALDVDGLSVDGVGVAGEVPQLDPNAKVARVGWSLTLSGSYQQTSNE